MKGRVFGEHWRASLMVMISVSTAALAAPAGAAASRAAARPSAHETLPPPPRVIVVRPDRRALARETLASLAATREQRRQRAVEVARERYADALGAAGLEQELRLHSERLAALHRIRLLTLAEGRDELVERASALLYREQVRHRSVVRGLAATLKEEQ